LIGTQWRGATNAHVVSWGAVLYETATDRIYEAPLREDIPIADRTGGGDSFASGVLAALLKGHDLQTAVEWGAAHGILVQETPGDITMVDERAVLAEACAREGRRPPPLKAPPEFWAVLPAGRGPALGAYRGSPIPEVGRTWRHPYGQANRIRVGRPAHSP
jgi:hypothetical protein